MRKGQFTVLTFLEVVLTLILFGVMYNPIIKPAIDTAIIGADPLVAFALRLLPFTMVLMIVLTMIWYAIPNRS